MATTTTTRTLSTKSDAGPPQFDAETSQIYKLVSENHRHPSGPWNKMLEKVEAFQRNLDQNFTVLDLASGPGEPAETIARKFPDTATVIATDVSPDQVAIATEKLAGLNNTTAQVADMENLKDFETDSMDLITCCYGFMFPPDIAKATRESYRVLKPGGQLIATTWNRIVVMEQIHTILDELVNKDKPEDNKVKPPINPMALSEPNLFEKYLWNAGYVDFTIESHQYPFDFGTNPDFHFKATIMIIQKVLEELDDGSNLMEQARSVYEKIKMENDAYYSYPDREVDDKPTYILPGNEYKLIVATKPDPTITKDNHTHYSCNHDHDHDHDHHHGPGCNHDH